MKFRVESGFVVLLGHFGGLLSRAKQGLIQRLAMQLRRVQRASFAFYVDANRGSAARGSLIGSDKLLIQRFMLMRISPLTSE
jgi:hypothetical protein